MHPIDTVKKIMAEFAESTGLSEVESPPRRYLWTDAFAVCNFIELHRQTRTENWRRLALALVDQVHSTLGRHRKDDSRTGWISGLTEGVSGIGVLHRTACSGKNPKFDAGRTG